MLPVSRRPYQALHHTDPTGKRNALPGAPQGLALAWFALDYLTSKSWDLSAYPVQLIGSQTYSQYTQRWPRYLGR